MNVSPPPSKGEKLNNEDSAVATDTGATGEKENPNPTSEFHKFPKLPTELRISIWEQAASFPRIVHIDIRRVEYSPGDEIHEEYYWHKPKFVSNSTVPRVLHVNKESRAVALKKYALSFPGHLTSPTVYFNKLVDTVYFMLDDWYWANNIIHYSIDLLSNAGIRYLALGLYQVFPGWNEPDTNFDILLSFDELQELILCIDKDPIAYDDKDRLGNNPILTERGKIILRSVGMNEVVDELDKESSGKDYQKWLENQVSKVYAGEKGRHPPQVKFMEISRMPKT